MPIRQGLAEAGPQSTALPVEIGFLAHHGHSPNTLRAAAGLAEFMGIPADEFLLRHGLVRERDFYRALAQELGLPFIRAFRLSAAAVFPDAIRAGLAPLAEPQGGFVLAPRGAALAQLFKNRRQAPSLCITTPSLLSKAVFETQARRIAHRAAHDLPSRRPHLSSRDHASRGQVAALGVLALMTAVGGYLIPGWTAALLATGLSPLFFGLVVLRLATPLLRHPVEPAIAPRRVEDRALPVYTIIVALYREKRIARRLIEALKRLDYPSAKLDIKLVLEAGDRETHHALLASGLPHFIEIIVAPPGHPRTKPRALNVALPLARGRYTVIYDAEDVPDPNQLRLAVASFRHLPRDIACLQARLTIDNTDDSWLTRLFTIEYAALFDVFNPGLAEIGSPVPLGGTSNHFRTSILKTLHGWDAWNVTEDADLGIRLARFGYRVADLPSSTLEEAPSTLAAWLRQRTRWMKGFLQTSLSHTRKPRRILSELGFWRSYAALALTVGTVLSALGYPFFTGLFLIQVFRGTPAAGTPWEGLWRAGSLGLFLLGCGAIFIPACVALARRRLWHLLPWMPLLPLYYALVSFAAWRGLWELVTAPSYWHKTSHGLARTSRTGAVQKHQAREASTMSLKTLPP